MLHYQIEKDEKDKNTHGEWECRETDSSLFWQVSKLV